MRDVASFITVAMKASYDPTEPWHMPWIHTFEQE